MCNTKKLFLKFFTAANYANEKV